ncbi:hypothetical protein BDZ89DRAFT_1125250 [Hymenopellis radicata]|nr:hypothetical protein BDZ89DRAFT_1125250 [Hymenopellis radicata]
MNIFLFASLLACLVESVFAFFYMAANNLLTSQRLDPIMYPGIVAAHAHSIIGASNISRNMTTADLRESACTSMPIVEDKSAYWYPILYFQHRDGTFSSVNSSASIQFDNSSETTPFPDNFRVIAGDSKLRSFNASSYAQLGVKFSCSNGYSNSQMTHGLPEDTLCSHGLTGVIDFPSCWDGVNLDSENHFSHTAYPSKGPDSGICDDPAYPITFPRVVLQVDWMIAPFAAIRDQAMFPSQPYVLSNGDPTGYSYHADFYNGWDTGVLQKAIERCNCDPHGNPTCCANNGTFTLDTTQGCFVSDIVDEQVLGTIPKLTGPNPVQDKCFEQYRTTYIPPILAPVYVSRTGPPTLIGQVIVPENSTGASQTAEGTCLRTAAPSGADGLYPAWIAAACIFMLGLMYDLLNV